MSIANVTINDTFDQWRTKTNQLIVQYEETNTLAINAYGSANSVSFTAANVTANILSSNTVFINSIATSVIASGNIANTVLADANLNNAIISSANALVYIWLSNTTPAVIYDQANVARDLANTTNTLSILSFNQGNAAYDQANSAFVQANLGFEVATAASVTSSAGFDQANIARTTANTTANVVGGSAGQVLYQSSANITSFTSTGSSGQVLISKGTNAPEWSSLIPAGTKMLFIQTSAPLGWTKDTTHDNKALRVVSGSAGSGGTVDFTTAFTVQSVAGTIASATATGTVGATTLTVAQIPSHNHYDGYTQGSSTSGGAFGSFIGVTEDDMSFSGTGSAHPNTSYTGGGQSHTHTFTGTAHNHAFTGTAINVAVKYVDVIIAAKDAY